MALFLLTQWSMTSLDAFYGAVAEEISSGRIEKATWAKAFAQSGADRQTAKSLYPRDRVKHLAADARRPDRRPGAPHATRHGKQLLLGIFAFVIGFSVSIAVPNGPYFLAKALTLCGFFYICRGLVGLASKPPTCIMSLCDAPCTALGHDRGYTIYECSQGHEFCI
jgi:hypothetical protein